MAGKFLVIGGAHCVWEDIEYTQSLFFPDQIVAINDIGAYIDGLDHWVTMHPEKMSMWMAKREEHGFDKPKLWTSVHKAAKIKNSKDFETINSQGGGGILGVLVAKILKADKVVLAGIPMTRGSHFNKQSSWMECDLYKQFWRGQKTFPHFVRSVSGWTKDYYGVPTEGWLKET